MLRRGYPRSDRRPERSIGGLLALNILLAVVIVAAVIIMLKR